MNKNRPVNLNLAAFRFPVTSISSILHRISGVILFLSVPLCLWALQSSLTPGGFAEVKSVLSSGIAKFITWAILSMLAYHIIAGVRHLLMDAGIGETLQGGRFGANAVIALGVLTAVGIGVWIW
ncbi:succinate dehydrogenase, cytochrome b556 subunit [Aliikangiella coralliicola]|uniref:Succinate dehydrogenase cytochrome b556 subunit n=1 Tax=Aliikangiella coralliicola TaxID=2592383 RepID=A0A545U4M1_9GAMM|nr:succinate dehydrogenase, cytochrome b556 subunit [Aliikangiella coralliicola]TQV84421.1 succinate dehydrogenase, cytochrome b556 subunit [Aliikangiella coralliicola]